jgi:hypothetical protein
VSAIVGALRVSLGLDSAQFSAGLKQAQGGLARFGQIAKVGALAVAGAATAAVAALGPAIRSTIDAADDMSKAAAKIGIPIDTLSRLKYAADLSGVSFGGLQTALGALSKNMVAFGEDKDGAVAAFAALGVSATDASGQMRSTEDVLAEVADAFAAMPDGAEKTAAAMALFGKAGRDMIPLLNGGSGALRELLGEADRFGQVFSAETGAAAEQFNDNLSRLQGSFGAIAADLTARLLPYLAQFTEWLIANQTNIADVVVAIVDFAAGVAEGGANVARFVDDALTKLAAFPGEVVAIFAALPDQLEQVGRDIIDGLWAGIASAWEAIKAPIAGIAGAIEGLFRDETETQSPSRVMMRVGEDIMAGLQLGMESLQGQVEGGVTSFADRLSQTFADVLVEGGSFRDALRSLLAETASSVGGSLLQSGISAIGAAIGIPAFAGGTRFAPGGLALVGERGPELVNLPRGSQVIPNHALGGGGTVVHFAPVINAAGADAAGLAQVRAELRGMRDAFPDMVARAISDPRRRGAI